TAHLGAVEQRWVAQLANFKYVIKYRPGTQNKNEAGSGEEIFQVVVPKQEARKVWETYHGEMGHPSSERTLTILRQHCYWPRMTEDVKEWTTTCPQCVCAKAGPEVRVPLVSILTSYPFEVVGVDYLSRGQPEDRYPYILVVTDLFSKYAFAVPTRDQSANTTAQALYNNLIQTFGCPERILTDRGASFESSLMKELCQLYGCQKSRTTAYHPQGNGACERFNQTLLGLLNSLDETSQAQWPNRLPALVQAYNNTIHSTTGITPHYVVFGRHARLPVN
uniref:Gypsy retrotransposon integrase-like protein 1 n=1 Tax=Cyprinus carpio TaxID=7962 RepID=A0A8C2EH56_CYPCA